MKYSLRNTLILLATLLIMVGGGYFYVQTVFSEDIENAKTELEEKRIESSALQDTAEMFSTAQANYNDVLFTRLNYPKELFPSHNSSQLYQYLQELNSDLSFTGLNYTLNDSTLNEDHGIINVTVQGEGIYENLTNFIYRIEYSRPLIQIENVQIDNISEAERLNRVNFQLTMGAFYRRGDWTEYRSDLQRSGALGNISHNPYYPLIHPVPPNTENLPDVDSSRLVVLTGARAHIIDQNGTLQRLNIGDRVYLGRLTTINLQQGEAIFSLNRGGIRDRVVLNIEPDNTQRN